MISSDICLRRHCGFLIEKDGEYLCEKLQKFIDLYDDLQCEDELEDINNTIYDY